MTEKQIDRRGKICNFFLYTALQHCPNFHDDLILWHLFKLSTFPEERKVLEPGEWSWPGQDPRPRQEAPRPSCQAGRALFPLNMDNNDLNFKDLLGLAHQTTQSSSKKNFNYANLKVRTPAWADKGKSWLA